MSEITAPWIGLSLMIENDFIAASSPLFEQGEVEVLEWSLDLGWCDKPIPEQVDELLSFYSEKNRLLGHGITYSPLSACRYEHQTRWLECLKQELDIRQYHHISEHFGWMGAGNFYQSAPLPLLLTKETLNIGRRNLERITDVFPKPIGIENLAFAFSHQDVLNQGRFINSLLESIEGFLVLDLHNLYCQVHNFNMAADELLQMYPLTRVNELHVSGGSWSNFKSNKNIRRDTHDDAVPEEVFELIPLALEKCPNVKAVILERLGGTFKDEEDMLVYRRDYRRIKQMVKNKND